VVENVIKPEEPQSTQRCPCCGYKTLRGRGHFEICDVCFWEDDGQDDSDADQVRGGPNRLLSLTQARLNFTRCGACDPEFSSKVRSPLEGEI
jgi:hypothetical protein